MNRNLRSPAWGGGIHVPPEFVSVGQLGEPKTVHGARAGGMTGLIVVASLGLGLVVLGAVLLVAGVSLGGLVLLVIGAALSGLAAWNFVRLRGSVRCFVEYQAGFAVLVRSTVTEWPWHEVAAVITKDKWVSGKRSVYHERRCDIVRTDGQTVILLGEGVESAPAIVATVKAHARANLLPALQANYDAGQSVTCGAVSVNRVGIQIENRKVAWNEVANVTVRKGRLVVVLKAGSPLKMTVWKIPNVELLGALIGVPPSDMDLVYD